MLAICCFIEQPRPNREGRQVEVEKWWDLTLAFGFDELLCVDPNRYEVMPGRAQRFASVADINAAYPSAMWVFAEEQADVPAGATAVSLDTFTHPTGDAIYCFGGNELGIRGAATIPGDWVYVPTVGSRSLWNIVAGALVLSSR